MSNLFENSISFHSSPLTSSDIDDEILVERSLLSLLIDYRDANLTPRASVSAASDSSNDDVRPHNRESPGNPPTAAQHQQPGKWLFSGHSHTDNSSDDIDTIIVIPDNTRHDKKRQRNTSEQQSTVYNKTTTLSDQTMRNNQSNTDIGTTQMSDSQPNRAEARTRDVHCKIDKIAVELLATNFDRTASAPTHPITPLTHSEPTPGPSNAPDQWRSYRGGSCQRQLPTSKRQKHEQQSG